MVKALLGGGRLQLKHTTRCVRTQLRGIVYRVDVNTLHRTEAESLGVNDIALVRLRTAQPIMCDDYKRNAAGMVSPSSK